MTHADKDRYFQKHPDKTIVADSLRQNILQKVKDNNMSCAVAEEIARVGQVSIEEAGIAIDLLNINIVACQLGLFGYSPEKKIVQPALEIAPSLKNEIKNALTGGHLPCSAAWEIARKLKLPRMRVSAACEALQIKIKPCQLGAF